MQYAHTTAVDGCKLAFQTSLPLSSDPTNDAAAKYETLVILIHGFSGSSEYFTRNFEALSDKAWVVAIGKQPLLASYPERRKMASRVPEH